MEPNQTSQKGALVGCLLLCLQWVSGCASVGLSPELAEAQRAREASFAENIGRYPTTTLEQREVLRLLKEHYKKGVETFDIALIQSILAPDFEFRQYWSRERVTVQTKEAFLAERASWMSRQDPSRKLLINVQELKYDEKRALYAVATLTTHQTKYFAPRFAEMFVFAKEADKWWLRRQFVFPAYPPNPKLHEARIFVGDFKKPYPPGLAEEIKARGPDIVIDDYLVEHGRWRTDGVARPAIVVFREPVPEGSRVVIRHGPPSDVPGSTSMDTVRAPVGIQYFYVVMPGWSIRGSACVPFSIEVEGAVILQQVVCSR